MNDDSLSAVPQISDADIHWVSNLLGLEKDAFYGQDGNDPRQEVLKCMETFDVAACPGSGKTTLLVAKLAILAEKWPYRTRGICVLSHTNVARREIEGRLGNTVAGQRLLSFPHFIGTIHSFIDEFLSLPWLRSLGYPIRIVNTAICHKRRWGTLRGSTQNVIEVNRHGPEVLSIVSSDFDLRDDISWGRGTLGKDTCIYTEIQDACRKSAKEGYFCYEEMFVWAKDLMSKIPGVVAVVRDRFPIVFVDEAQDNSDEQSAILHSIFMEGEVPVRRQRFGDENQAIFGFEGANGAHNDFPGSDKMDLPNSHRFGPNAAKLADPLAVYRIPHGLKGQGPKRPLASGKREGEHTIFLFDEGSANSVLSAYGDLLIETFSRAEVEQGTFIAVGQRHKPPDTVDERKFPHCIRDYGFAYDPELSKTDFAPGRFAQYVFMGLGNAGAGGATHPAIEKIAEGILRLARLAEGEQRIPRSEYCHRCILRHFEKNARARRAYERLIFRLIVQGRLLTVENWEKRWRTIVRYIAEEIAGARLSGDDPDEFLQWSGPTAPTGAPCEKEGNNIYIHSRDGREVAIRVGSVHSVKGETHTAALVLETYWKGQQDRHNIELLLPWLEGTSYGAGEEKPEQQTRLKIHYVAMTRPTHLLCLAIQKSTLQRRKSESLFDSAAGLESRGWKIKDLTVG